MGKSGNMGFMRPILQQRHRFPDPDGAAQHRRQDSAGHYPHRQAADRERQDRRPVRALRQGQDHRQDLPRRPVQRGSRRVAYGIFDAIGVAKVKPEVQAWRIGLRSGDVLVQVNGKRVKKLDDLRKQAKSKKGIQSLRLRRGDSVLTIR